MEDLKAILLEARTLTGAARAAYLDRVCGGNPSLREEIDSLLAFESAVPSVMDDCGLLERLQSTPEAERTARYRCAICLAFPDGKLLETEATCEGRIGTEFHGKNGFGYDPIFVITDAQPEYSGQTMAQVPPEIKALISHRARALTKLRDLLKTAP